MAPSDHRFTPTDPLWVVRTISQYSDVLKNCQTAIWQGIAPLGCYARQSQLGFENRWVNPSLAVVPISRRRVMLYAAVGVVRCPNSRLMLSLPPSHDLQ